MQHEQAVVETLADFDAATGEAAAPAAGRQLHDADA